MTEYNLVKIKRFLQSSRQTIKANINAYSKFHAGNKFFSYCLTSYALITCILFLHYKVLVFDEVWFSCCFSDKGFSNHLGYGYLYWLLIDFLSNAALRMIALICMWSIPFTIYKFGKKLKLDLSHIKLVILLWLSYPAAWWCGKLIGAELYSVALGFVGLYLAIHSYSKKISSIGVILMGISTGVKIPYIVFPFFYYFYLLLDNCKIRKSIFKDLLVLIKKEKFGLLFIVGFLAGSPNVILFPSQWLDNILQYSNSKFNLHALHHLYSMNMSDFWEGVITPSVTLFSLSIPSIALILLLWKKWKLNNIKLQTSFFMSCILSLILLMKSYSYLSWHLLPIIVLSLLFFLSFQIPRKYFIAIILVNFLFNAPVSFSQVTNKVIQIKNWYKQKEINDFINKQYTPFVAKYPDSYKCVAINPAEGSCIISVNAILHGDEKATKPYFLAVHTLMMVAYANNSTIYSHIEHLFGSSSANNFKEHVFSLEKRGYHINFLGKIENTYLFTIIPEGFNKK